MVFKDLIYQDKTRYDAKYLILPSLVGTWDFITEDSLSVLYKSKGEYKFKNDFNFRTFPFDKQKIDIFIYQSRYPLGDYQASVSDWTKRELLTFQNNNDITGWNIVGNRIEYKTYKGPNDKYFLDGIQLTLDIERKSGYYIFKVIIPIILILIVCWSSIWIDPREIESRLTITIVCLLSLIAYNFVIDSEMPKLEYLTVMDHIILVSYAYATIPNFLSIVSFNLLKKRNKRKLAHQLEYFEKRYGLLSYLVIVFLIVVVSSNTNPENSYETLLEKYTVENKDIHEAELILTHLVRIGESIGDVMEETRKALSDKTIDEKEKEKVASQIIKLETKISKLKLKLDLGSKTDYSKAKKREF